MSNDHEFKEHQQDVHGKKVRCGVCYNFVFPISCWRLYRRHHQEQHFGQEYADCLAIDAAWPKKDATPTPPAEVEEEEWQVPPEDGFLELGSPTPTLYSPISSDWLSSSESEWETVSEREIPDDIPKDRVLAIPATLPEEESFMPWKLVPIDVEPSWPFYLQGLTKEQVERDPRFRAQKSFFDENCNVIN